MISEFRNQFTKIPAVVFKNFGSVTALRILQMGLGLITTYFLANILSKEMFGQYHFVISTVAILAIFGMGGFNDSIMQAFARGFQGTFRRAVPIAFASSLIGSVILAGFAFWYYMQGNEHLVSGFAVACGIFPFLHGLTQWKSSKSGTENFVSLSLILGIMGIIMHAAMVTLILLFPNSFLGPLTALLAVPSIVNIIMVAKLFAQIPKDAPVEQGNIIYGVKTTFYGAFNIASRNADKLLLFFFLSPEALATFVIAEKFAELVRSTTQDVSAVLGPRFAKFDHYTKKLDKTLKFYVSFMGIGIIVFAFLFLPFLISLIFGQAYESSIPYAQALLCSVAIGNIAMLRFRFIRSRLHEKSFRTVTVSTSLIRILLSLALVPFLGIWGAVASTFLYRVAMTIIVGFTIREFVEDDL